eukprot:364813-Chlamydomonas_euryale.AAC.4
MRRNIRHNMLAIFRAASPGGVVVSELTPGGSAAMAGVQVGDVLRATTAATMRMTYPPMNLMFGGGLAPRHGLHEGANGAGMEGQSARWLCPPSHSALPSLWLFCL